MTPEPNPMHKAETTGKDTELVELTDVPGGVPLDSPEVLERNRRRQEQIRQQRERGDTTEHD